MITEGNTPAAMPGGRAMMSPRKQMGYGTKSPGNVAGAPAPMQSAMVPHPDAGMKTGVSMEDSSRAATPPTSGGGGRMASPGAVDHGPHNHRYGK